VEDSGHSDTLIVGNKNLEEMGMLRLLHKLVLQTSVGTDYGQELELEELDAPAVLTARYWLVD
jgi:hypothetical protein